MRNVHRVWLFCVLALAIGSQAATAASVPTSDSPRFTGFVEAANSRQLYVDYQKPQSGQPIVVLVNGLTYSTTSWNSFASGLGGEGLGILRIDLMGQGKTLYKVGPPRFALDYQEQVSDIVAVLNNLQIFEGVHLVGLSYGGALALVMAEKYPERVASVILMAPFTEPIKEQDEWIKQQIQITRTFHPYNKSTDGELYDFFLRYIVYSTYPLAEPVVLEHPYKLEATYRLVQGARTFFASDIINRLPENKIHLMIARRDQYIKNSVLENFWSQMPMMARMTLIYLELTEHKIPEAMPKFSSAWVKMLVLGDPRFRKGETYIGNPLRGTVNLGPQKIADLPKY